MKQLLPLLLLASCAPPVASGQLALPILSDTNSGPQSLNAQQWGYSVKGDREVRPAAIGDDGFKTQIQYAPGQALPAVFAIGPAGEEEVVNGYMRGDFFVIDRVYNELVFRIDRKRAVARRSATANDTQ
ncbi:hypothetical protein HME9302_00084 [Alteripontixanthobacter maritimus]|uniref:Uncharacterized protein n=1 Tax=Alteripontixanthobacter maritimus TaxID=2161824 RepID=A0A369Q9E8_9SPHN|nr:TrbG/VirB9 family P-type conjugative transfer protein [Alteripontixanthobacter maritimus]RDC58908.1 hypothetical protein HME9302_00084 [Alteripontixanthobacter maritimus]